MEITSALQYLACVILRKKTSTLTGPYWLRVCASPTIPCWNRNRRHPHKYQLEITVHPNYILHEQIEVVFRAIAVCGACFDVNIWLSHGIHGNWVQYFTKIITMKKFCCWLQRHTTTFVLRTCSSKCIWISAWQRERMSKIRISEFPSSVGSSTHDLCMQTY